MNEQQAQAIEREADNIPLVIGFKRLSENAVIPTKAHASDSGFDIYAADDILIAPGETVVVPTDIAIVLPKGYEAYIKNRSGVSSKTKLRVISPPIDEGYRGAIGIIVDNITDKSDINGYDPYLLIDGTFEGRTRKGYSGTYLIRKGDRLAQLTVQPRPDTVAVEITDELDSTERGGRGFGSSGV